MNNRTVKEVQCGSPVRQGQTCSLRQETVGMGPHCQMLARNNTLANGRLYAACAELSEAERKRHRRAFFKTIHGTLNHIMVGDRIWLTRFRGGEAGSTGLDAILYEDFSELRAARVAEDRRIEARSAERRVGKGGGSRGTSRGPPSH